jgi:hypothetical protein
LEIFALSENGLEYILGRFELLCREDRFFFAFSGKKAVIQVLKTLNESSTSYWPHEELDDGHVLGGGSSSSHMMVF